MGRSPLDVGMVTQISAPLLKSTSNALGKNTIISEKWKADEVKIRWTCLFYNKLKMQDQINSQNVKLPLLAFKLRTT